MGSRVKDLGFGITFLEFRVRGCFKGRAFAVRMPPSSSENYTPPKRVGQRRDYFVPDARWIALVVHKLEEIISGGCQGHYMKEDEDIYSCSYILLHTSTPTYFYSSSCCYDSRRSSSMCRIAQVTEIPRQFL